MKTRELLMWALVLTGLSLVLCWPVQGWEMTADPSAAATLQDDGDQDETDETDEAEEDDDDELTLEWLFGEDRPRSGPTARSMAFSHDGRYGAYLFTPYPERRHGTDIWLYDTETGETTRLTRVSVMAEFQQSARDVKEDRIRKARERLRKERDRTENGENGASGDDSNGAQGGRAGRRGRGGARRGGRGGGGAAPMENPALFALDADGVWEGRLTSDQDIGLPPDGLPFTLTIRVGDNGAVTGQFETDLVTTEISSGEYDEESGELRCTLTDPASGMAGNLEAKIERDRMTATIRVDALNATLNLEATRTGDAGAMRDQQRQQRDDDEDEDEQQDDELHEDELGDTVGEDDADDRRAPRYGGIGSFAWSPTSHEMIFSSEGDLYRLMIDSGEIHRLTRTQENERGVDYLPDGSGYTYMQGDSLIKVSFGSHLREQLDPQLPGGFSLDSYQLSPDGKRVIILASSGGNRFSGGTTVNIISYRGRLAQVREVSRHMPPDEFPDLESKIFYYNLGDFLHEHSELAEVFTHKHTGPRDSMRVPEWAPDSSRVAFAVFDQNTSHVGIYEAVFPDSEEEEAEDDDPDRPQTDDADDDDDDDQQIQGRGRRGGRGGGARPMEVEERPAKMVYRFFHNGGPNTPGMIVPFYLADSRRMAFITELSGFRQLHLLDPLYESLTQVTSGQWELYPIEVSKDHKRIFATANKDDPAQEHVVVVDLETNELTQLTTTEGVYNGVAISPDGTKVLANHVDWGKFSDLVAIDADGEMTRLTDSHPEDSYKLIEPVPSYFTYKNRHGHTIHGHMFTPLGWEPSDDDKRPLVVYVYGGPLGSRNMISRGAYSAPSYYFAYYLAKVHGYVTCTIDPRGMSGYGGLFEKSSFEGVGRAQTEDLVDGIRWMVENHHVDEKKVGMHGWSFGGFQTQMVMYTEPDVLACGIAGAGPTEWVNYNSWYTTGTIGERENIVEDPDDEKYSLVPLAKNLKGELLLVHGMEDSNVLYQDTVKVYRALLQAGKETLVELFLDPTGGHGLGGDVDTLKRYRKFEEFFTRHLGSIPPPDDEDNDDEEDDD